MSVKEVDRYFDSAWQMLMKVKSICLAYDGEYSFSYEFVKMFFKKNGKYLELLKICDNNNFGKVYFIENIFEANLQTNVSDDTKIISELLTYLGITSSHKQNGECVNITNEDLDNILGLYDRNSISK